MICTHDGAFKRSGSRGREKQTGVAKQNKMNMISLLEMMDN